MHPPLRRHGNARTSAPTGCADRCAVSACAVTGLCEKFRGVVERDLPASRRAACHGPVFNRAVNEHATALCRLAMLSRLRRYPLQRALIALLVTALLSLGGAAHACKATQMLALTVVAASNPHGGHGPVHAVSGDTGAAAQQPADLLRHGGPCHLLITVVLPSRPRQAVSEAPSAPWPEAAALGFKSCSWPPLEHRLARCMSFR
jgi:hypothetical protein